MSTVLFFGQSSGGDADRNAVRSTTHPVQQDIPAAEQKDAPEFNEFESDPNPDIGLGPRQLASDWHETEKYAPFWIGEDKVDREVIDRKIATSGTAAAREAAGQFGHGTMGYAYGIEPVIRDGAEFGADYFAANKQGGFNSHSTSDTGVQPVDVNQDDLRGITAYGKDAARDASVSVYDQFLGISR